MAILRPRPERVYPNITAVLAGWYEPSAPPPPPVFRSAARYRYHPYPRTMQRYSRRYVDESEDESEDEDVFMYHPPDHLYEAPPVHWDDALLEHDADSAAANLESALKHVVKPPRGLRLRRSLSALVISLAQTVVKKLHPSRFAFVHTKSSVVEAVA